VVGEMGLLLKKPRRATVKAVTRAGMLFVPQSAFQKLMRQHPDMAARFAARIEDQLGSYLGALDRFRRR
jgi:CRP-like cAMP-binding protein